MMKTFQILFFCCFISSAYALYEGNPYAPEIPEYGIWISDRSPLSFRLSVLGDQSRKRKLQIKDESMTTNSRKDWINHQTYKIVPTLNFIDRIDLFGTLGTMQLVFKQKPASNEQFTYHTPWDFVWGVGGKASLIYWRKAILSLSGQYETATLAVSSIDQNGKKRSAKGAKLGYNEWQVGIEVGTHITCFYPYVALLICQTEMRVQEIQEDPQFSFNPPTTPYEAKRKIGVGFGFSLAAKKGVSVNLEGRAITENGVGGGLTLRF